jgi:hypothetical protein
MAVTLVVAWGTGLQDMLGYRRATNKRHAHQLAAELEEELPWSPRISLYEEVDFLATPEGLTEKEQSKALEHVQRRSH